ncbi:MAG: MFS transporter [Bryobacteraceae bacterium]|jgi:MFS family permease
MSQGSAPDAKSDASPFAGVSRNVFLLSLVSLFTDFSSEMIYPLVPLFLSITLGAPVAAIGVIEGLAESTASIFKWISGVLSDRLGKRKPFLLAGYGLAAATKPLLALAFAWPVVLSARVLDRFGKGLRGSPRDALISDSTPAQFRGRAFGFHRSGDSIGAVLGPLVALGILVSMHENYRAAFLLAFLPGLASTLLILPVREIAAEKKAGLFLPSWRSGLSNPALRRFLIVTFVFGLGNSSDMFLILRAKQLGGSSTTAVLLFAFGNLINVLCSYPAGIVSDRIGRKKVLVAGFSLFAVVYLGFGLASSVALLWICYGFYGAYLGLTDGVAKALVVDLVPQSERGGALGLQAMVLGICTLPASLLAGVIWQYAGPQLAFLFGSGMALVATVLMLGLPVHPVVARPRET